MDPIFGDPTKTQNSPLPVVLRPHPRLVLPFRTGLGVVGDRRGAPTLKWGWKSAALPEGSASWNSCVCVLLCFFCNALGFEQLSEAQPSWNLRPLSIRIQRQIGGVSLQDFKLSMSFSNANGQAIRGR